MRRDVVFSKLVNAEIFNKMFWYRNFNEVWTCWNHLKHVNAFSNFEINMSFQILLLNIMLNFSSVFETENHQMDYIENTIA